MTDPNCKTCLGQGWVCEKHPDQPYEHDGCGGAGNPCRCNPEEAMQPGTRIRIDLDHGYRH